MDHLFRLKVSLYSLRSICQNHLCHLTLHKMTNRQNRTSVPNPRAKRRRYTSYNHLHPSFPGDTFQVVSVNNGNPQNIPTNQADETLQQEVSWHDQEDDGIGTLEDDVEWAEALAPVPVDRSDGELCEIIDGQIPLRLDDCSLRKLLSGKALEAASWLIGNGGLPYKTYRRFAASMNFYMGQLQQDKYPSYGTLINKTIDILNSLVVMKRYEIEATVNTSRSGVGHRHTRAQHTGNIPKTTFSMVLPSSWAVIDVRQYPLFYEQKMYRVRRPTCVDIEYSPILPTDSRRQNEVGVYEILPDSDGYTTGRELHPGDAILIHLTGNDEIVNMLAAADPCVTVTVQHARRVAIFQGRLGETQIAVADDILMGIRACDAVSTILHRSGTPWRNASMVHRFAPKAGARATAVIIPSEAGESPIELRWTELRHDTQCESLAESIPPTNRVGKLIDGRDYVIIRCLLYSDDFKPYAFKNSSCGGFYMLPLGIPTWTRTSTHALRIISLTPPGVSSEVAIYNSITDLVRASSQGVPGRTADGRDVTIFLDILGYVADYPESAHLLDVTGVTGASPCTLCTFPRANVGNADDVPSMSRESSSYAYTSAIHSGNLSFRRTRTRMQISRGRADERELKRLGLRSYDSLQPPLGALHHLSMELEKARPQVPWTSQGDPVVSCWFDPYLSSFVAPDHVLFGVGEDIVKCMLGVMQPAERAQFNVLSMEALASVGYDAEGSFLGASTQKLNQMSMSSFTGLLLVAPWSVRMACQLPLPVRDIEDNEFMDLPVKHAILHTLYMFRKLYVWTTFVPQEALDGRARVQAMEGSSLSFHIQSLQRMVTKYVRRVNLLCRYGQDVRKAIDKPNIHRLVELYYHSIPRFGHVSLFQELVLEGGHQPLKKGIQRSNNHNPHLHAMTRHLADDWMKRVGDKTWAFSNLKQMTEEDCHSLLEVAFSRSDALDTGLVSCDDVRRSFPEFVLRQFRSIGGNGVTVSEIRWVWVPFIRHSAELPALDAHVSSFLRAVLQLRSRNERLHCYNCTVRVSLRSTQTDQAALSTSKRYHPRHSLIPGDTVQVLLQHNFEHSICDESDVTLLPLSETDGVRTFWQIVGLYGVQKELPVYAHVRKMSRISDSSSVEDVYGLSISASPKYILELTGNVRKVLSLPDCTASDVPCVFNTRTGVMRHNHEEHVARILMGSQEGFPPRAR